MMNNEKALNLLGLATRAGKMISGEELVLQSVRSKKAKLVIISTDASDNTRKKLLDKCAYYQVPCVTQFTHGELSHAIGKDRKSCAIQDTGFATKLQELIQS